MPESSVRAQGSTRDAIREFFAAERRNAERIQKFNLGLTDEDELPPYVHQEYPKALYAPDGETIVVESAAEERRHIGEGYYASLAEYLAATEVEMPETEETAPAPKRSHSKKPVPA